METPRIYVGTYAKYNAGSLEGKWFDLEDYSDKDEFIEACQEFHGEGEHEFMFQTSEGIPRHFISESYIDPEFWDFLDFEDYHDGDAKTAYVEHFGEWSEGGFQDHFSCQCESELAYAENYIEDCGLLDSVPENLRWYFDYEKFARDIFINDCVFVDGFVFYR